MLKLLPLSYDYAIYAYEYSKFVTTFFLHFQSLKLPQIQLLNIKVLYFVAIIAVHLYLVTL